ncbi:MAG: pyruvate dehydrogenase [Chloroflexi bacterium]|nr:pyruvate dehydrogenase [Chloroflexota bacterium]MBA3586011.1 pyruvate dehydrogenase [Chloroflexota bacterium]
MPRTETTLVADQSYRSDTRPDFTPFEISSGTITGFAYRGDLASELAAKTITRQAALDLLDDMLAVRELEEMIVRLRSGGYQALPGYDYRGPTHVSIGQEGAAVGASVALRWDDNITSSHRGHGDAIAKGFSALRQMSDDQLAARVGSAEPGERLEAALEEHVFRTIAELFGKEQGYNAGRGGGMHIADYTTGNIGANAIVGGSVPIATGAAMAARYQGSDRVVCCFAGDGAYANGVVLESLNWAAQHQWTNHLAGDRPFGLPIIYFIQNNHYGMTHRTDDEVMGVTYLARRAAGFAENNMHAEVVNGMDVLAVRDAVRRAAELCRSGQGPVLIEASTYRFYGHSLSDPRNEYRTREEESAWRAIDPVERLREQLLETGVADASGLEVIATRARERNERAAVRAAASPDPDPADVLTFLYTDESSEIVPDEDAAPALLGSLPEAKRDDVGQITYKDAIREALVEEMARDARVIHYGEDIADYGGAFKLTKGLLEAFGRARVFNTPISEACICGTAVGAAMAGTRPVVELMYMDFALMASDQIANQAAKWHYMSGGQVQVPLVIRASVGAGKGYGGQHSQSLESIFTHTPGLYVVYPSNPADAKGLLKAAIRTNNPVMFVESQGLYTTKGAVAEGDVVVPIGRAAIARAGSDATIVSWGPAVLDSLAAAQSLQDDHGISAEVIDLRSLVPLDIDTVLASVRKTGRCVVASQAVISSSFVNEVLARVQIEAFDDLDGPVQRVGALAGISPQAESLERAFLPNAGDIVAAVLAIG